MTEQEKKLINKLKYNLAVEYPSLNENEQDICFEKAVGDYLRLKYPSDNNRLTPETLTYTFAITSWVYARMLDICGRAGIPKGVTRYSENNLTFEYSEGSIDPDLVKQIMPKGAIPR